MSDEPHLLTEEAGPILIATLNRPEKLNALSASLMKLFEAAVHHLPSEFTFPSGRRCKTFDDLAQGCQEEWTAARDLLMRGVFAKYFQTCNRADLVRAANDAKAVPNPDIALTTFLASLPGTRTQTPKVDLNPRRILLGNVVGLLTTHICELIACWTQKFTEAVMPLLYSVWAVVILAPTPARPAA